MPESSQVYVVVLVKPKLEVRNVPLMIIEGFARALSVRAWARRQQEGAANVSMKAAKDSCSIAGRDGGTNELTFIGRVKREI